jgi:hypothetical protein
LQKNKPHKLESLRDLLTTDEAVRRCVDNGLPDTTAGMLSMRRVCALEPRSVQFGRAVRYRQGDIDDWCKQRLAERAQAAARNRAGRDE